MVFIKIIVLCIILSVLPICIFTVGTFSTNQNGHISKINASSQNESRVGMVLGAEVYGIEPSNVLKWRLKKAASLYNQKIINKILVSGSNQSEFYNEPAAMSNYLIETEKIPESDIISDFAGMRTYDSCWRAKNVFKINKLVVVTQPFHLPRANFICQILGIETTPISANNSTPDVTRRGIIREIGASWNAVYDLMVGTKPVFTGNGTEETL